MLLYLSLIEIAVRFLAIFIRNLVLWDEDAPQKSFRAPKYQIGERKMIWIYLISPESWIKNIEFSQGARIYW